MSKGNLAGAADGYGFRTTGVANELQWFVNGASDSGGPTDTDATWFDGEIHCAVGTSSGTSQSLYLDGTLAVAASAVTHGSVSNAVALVVGADNAGASGHMALNPAVAWAVYMRVLTATEITAASRYLLGACAQYRMPAGPATFIDLRDDRCWDGRSAVAKDLSGNRNHAILAGSPGKRGYPWPLHLLEAT